jgi:hypothetical protein
MANQSVYAQGPSIPTGHPGMAPGGGPQMPPSVPSPMGHAMPSGGTPSVGLHAYLMGHHHGMVHGIMMGHAMAHEEAGESKGLHQAPSNHPTGGGAR